MGALGTLFRDTFAGQLARRVISSKALPYVEEEAGFRLPSSLEHSEKSGSGTSTPPNHGDTELDATTSEKNLDGEKNAEPGPIVDWYGPEDPENPQNWSTMKKSLVFAEICLLTFAIYIGSSIVITAQPTLIELFGVSHQAASLSLSVYVLGYGIGPLIFGPLSEVPRLGRNISYISSLALFLVVCIAAAFVQNFPGFIVLRFLQGLLGSPVLATGGASASDLFGFHKLAYALAFWSSAAFAGPALGPVLSAFAVEGATWRWTQYELIILGGFTFIVVCFFLPETNADTILLRRAIRLRKTSGNSKLRSVSEIRQGELIFTDLVLKYLATPMKVTIQDPSVAFINIYTALIYAIYYSYFESFPLVYAGIYSFSLTTLGIFFTALLIACVIGGSTYILLVYFIYEPYTIKNGIGVPEYRLVPGIWTAAFAPIGVLIFALTARSDIHWVVPTIGVLIYSSCQFVLGGVIFFWLATSYPRFAASLFAGNTFFRSALAAGAIHFSQPLFENLGIARGCGLLSGLLAACFIGITVLWYYGASLRARSKFAETY